MSEYDSFAEVLEKRAAVYTTQDLEERYARKKAREEVEDLKRSKSLAAYPVGAAAGAGGAAALPAIFGASSHFGSQERHRATTREAESRKLSALVKKLLPTLDDETRAHLASRLAMDLNEAAAPAEAVTIMRQNAAGLLREAAGRGDPGARDRAVALVDEIVQRLGRREHPDAPVARAVHAVGERIIPGEAPPEALGAWKASMPIPEPARAGVGDVSRAIAIDAAHDAPEAVFGAHRYAIGPVERRNMLAMAEDAVREQGVNIDPTTIRRAIDRDAMARLAKSALPFAALGGLGGLLAVRSKRKKLEELERGR